jgi:hypothetical protein
MRRLDANLFEDKVSQRAPALERLPVHIELFGQAISGLAVDKKSPDLCDRGRVPKRVLFLQATIR